MKDSTKPKLKSVRLKPDLISTVEHLAERDNRTFNNMVETLLIKATQNHQPMM